MFIQGAPVHEGVGETGILFPMFIQEAPAHEGVELGVDETVVFYFQCLFR